MEALINYLTDVYDRKKIGGINQDFFIKIKELDKKLEKYFLFFENESELKSDIESYYNRIKHMSFPHEDSGPYYIKHLSTDQNGNPISGNVSYPPEWHNNYSHNIHSYLIKVFKDKLGIKKKTGEIMHANLMQFSKDKPEVQKKKEYSLSQIALNKKQYLKDLFKDSNTGYSKIINLLIKYDFLVDNNDDTFDWKGATEDPSLKAKTFICILTLLLYRKNYIKTNLSNKAIATALSNTFRGITITPKTYGENKTNFDFKKIYTKPFHFIN